MNVNSDKFSRKKNKQNYTRINDKKINRRLFGSRQIPNVITFLKKNNTKSGIESDRIITTRIKNNYSYSCTQQT